MSALRMGTIMGSLAIFSFFMAGDLPAAEYPQKPVQILVGFTAGGSADLSARALAEAAKPFFPKTFAVVNRPGGGSVLATSELIKAAPDGYTLGLLDISALSVSPHLRSDLPYKPGVEDVRPIISCTIGHLAFAGKADAPWKTMNELIEYAKANPGKIRVGHAGLGSTSHLHLMSLKVAGVPLTDVPFQGAAPSITALLGGHIEGVVMSVTPFLPHVRAGKLRYLGYFGDERDSTVPELKDVPTLKELGYNVITEGTPYFIAAPKGTPQRILDTLHDTFVKAEKSDFYRKFCLENMFIIELKGAAELKKDIESAYTFYGDFLTRAGMKEGPKK